MKSTLLLLLGLAARAIAQDDYDDECEDEISSTGIATVTSSPSVAGCPPISATTTDTVTYVTPGFTETTTVTFTDTVYQTTYTSSVPQPVDQTGFTYQTITVARYTETVSTGPTFTSVSFVVLPAESTTTIPTPAGFTPLKCQSAYAGPYVTTTISYTTTITTNPRVVVTEPSTTVVIFPSSLIFPSTTVDSTTTFTTGNTITVTSTRTAGTVYAACATDNVVAEAPPSKYKYVNAAIPAGTVSDIVPAVDQVDCCALCQAREGCTGSAWYSKPILGVSLDTRLTRTACQLFLRNGTTCDQSQVGQTMLYDYPELVNYYSNGPCGQFNFTLFPPLLVNHVF